MQGIAKRLFSYVVRAGLLGLVPVAFAGPYSASKDDPTKPDAPVPGFVGVDGVGKVTAGNSVNPIFSGWVAGVAAYSPAPGVAAGFDNPNLVKGPVTGNQFDIVSLGDLTATQIAGGVAAGSITLTFDRPIADRPGADFVVFENGLTSGGGSGVAGQHFGELAYVEVSANGTDFVRFPSISATPSAVDPYGTFDATNVQGLAGKHANGYGVSWGTPFDLAALAGQLDIAAVTHVRIVDIPGQGSFLDSQGHAIYDPWFTQGSAGFDLEAVGVISHLATYARWRADHGLAGPIEDGDGVDDPTEYALGMDPARASRDGLPALSVEGGYLALTFVRDSRKTDVAYIVQCSTDMSHWEDIARSEGGEPTSSDGLEVQASAVVEESASPIASIGVLRRVTVRDSAPVSDGHHRFLRLKMEIAP